MKPDTIITDIEIADVNFQVEITFDRTPPVGEYDEEIHIQSILVLGPHYLEGKKPIYLVSLEILYNFNVQFKSRINQLVLDVIHDNRPEPGAKLVDARWDLGPSGPVDEGY